MSNKSVNILTYCYSLQIILVFLCLWRKTVRDISTEAQMFIFAFVQTFLTWKSFNFHGNGN